MNEQETIQQQIVTLRTDLDIQKDQVMQIAKKADEAIKSKTGWLSAVTGPIYVAIIGGCITLVLGINQRRAEVVVKEIANQHEFIKEAMSANAIPDRKKKLALYLDAGLITDCNGKIRQSIEYGPINEMQFQIEMPKPNASVLIDSTVFVSGTFGTVRKNTSLLVLVQDASSESANPLFYPTVAKGKVTVSANGKWFTNVKIGIKGKAMILIGEASQSLVSNLDSRIGNNNFLAFPIEEKDFRVLDFVNVYGKK